MFTVHPKGYLNALNNQLSKDRQRNHDPTERYGRQASATRVSKLGEKRFLP
jgi:hypothetical protein